MPEKTTTGKVKKGVAARRVAVEVLIAIDNEGAYSTIALNAAFKRSQLSERDRAFVTALVQGVMRHRFDLDARIAALSTQPLEKMPASLRNTLRVGVFQLEHMDDIPSSAVVNTSTDLAKILGHQGHAKFANGLLRNYVRRKEKDAVPKVEQEGDAAVQPVSAEPEPIDYSATSLSMSYSVPEWLVTRWLDIYGPEETLKLLEFAQSTPEVTIRVCESAITPEGLEQIFTNSDIEFRRSKLVNSCLVLESTKHRSAEKLPGYSDGLFIVQDEAAAFVSVVTDPKPGQLVIDLCAAPGGKTLHMAELMENTGRVYAIDKHASRLNLLRENRNRLGLMNIEIVPADGREFTLEKLADKVLIDAPCTGTGVINRRSDLRYRREPLDIASLSELQRQLLANGAKLVKPGGILVYSTCSIEPEENFDNIRWFMREFPEFEGSDLSPYLPPMLQDEVQSCWTGPACKTEAEMTTPYMIQLLPSRHGVSGFFVCRLRKRTD